MTSVDELWLGEERLADFMQTTWRRAPVIMRGAAQRTVPGVIGRERFFEAAQRVEQRRPDRVAKSEDGTVFVQEIDQGDDELARIASAFQTRTTCSRVWFDGVFATAGSGIGSHYDVSDNFVIQQHGHKRWRLHDPGVIPPSELRARILGAPGVGSVPMPLDALELDLGPGDMLYIPALWLHWGVSEDDSISVSLVFNAQTALDALLDEIRRTLSDRRGFWHLAPVTMRDGPRGLSEGAAAEIEDAVTRHLPIDGVVDPDLYHRPEIGIPNKIDLPPPPDLDAPDELPLPRGDLKRLYGDPLPALDAGACLFPDERTSRLLRASTGRVYLKRVLKLAQGAFPQIEDPSIRASVAVAIERLLGMDARRVWDVALRPEMTCWVHVMHRAMEAGYAPRIAEVAAVLPRLLAGSLLVAGALRDGDRLRLELPRPGEVHLEPFGLTASLPDPAATQAWLSVSSEGGELRYRFTAGDGLEPTGWTAAPRVQPGGLALVYGDAWIEGHYPRGAQARAEPLWMDLGEEDKQALAQALGDGMTILSEEMPEMFDEVTRSVDVLVPVRGRGLEPLNESVHAMRGLVAISARPDYLAAQSLVHETAHNRLSSLLDVHRLVLNPDREQYRSPFTGSDRPMVNLVHGVFSFVQEVALNTRLYGHVYEHPGYELASYTGMLVERIGEALDTIRRHGRLTSSGDSLIHRIELALDEGRRHLPKPTVSMAMGATA